MPYRSPYEGKRVAIAGCFSGMGEAAANELVNLGAEVHGADMRKSSIPLASFHTCDFRDPAAIESTLEAIGEPLDALFNCVGVPAQTHTPIDVMRVNFIGTRHWTNAARRYLRDGSAVASIASTVAYGFRDRLAPALELASTPTYDAAVDWCESHPEIIGDGYRFSKDTLIAWTLMSATEFIEHGIRINCVSPAPTTTPMMDDFETGVAPAVIDIFTKPIGRRALAIEQAMPLIFLNSDAASYINGHNLNVDGGFTGAVVTGELDVSQEIRQVSAS